MMWNIWTALILYNLLLSTVLTLEVPQESIGRRQMLQKKRMLNKELDQRRNEVARARKILKSSGGCTLDRKQSARTPGGSSPNERSRYELGKDVPFCDMFGCCEPPNCCYEGYKYDRKTHKCRKVQMG